MPESMYMLGSTVESPQECRRMCVRCNSSSDQGHTTAGMHAHADLACSLVSPYTAHVSTCILTCTSKVAIKKLDCMCKTQNELQGFRQG